MDEAGLRAALIGGTAVNAYAEPRFTRDLDFTVVADVSALARFASVLKDAGFEIARQQESDASSGPDFLQFIRPGTPHMVDIITARTEYQNLVIERTTLDLGKNVGVATLEDLIVLKLIANRPQDHVDTFHLARDNAIDWGYVEHWAQIWHVSDYLAALRQRLIDYPNG